MRKCLLMTLVVSILVCGTAAMSGAAVKKKIVKPAPKKPVAAPTAPTVQLAGDNGLFGNVFKIKKEGTLFFRLKSAEYTTEQVVMGDTLYVPTSEEKLLVLHLTIQNPSKSEQFVRWDSLNFTAVDSMNNNHEGNSDWGDDDALGQP